MLGMGENDVGMDGSPNIVCMSAGTLIKPPGADRDDCGAGAVTLGAIDGLASGLISKDGPEGICGAGAERGESDGGAAIDGGVADSTGARDVATGGPDKSKPPGMP